MLTTGIRGIVIIDEFEQHLHPSWQRQILLLLSEQFPKVQFIATSHSPLPAAASRAPLPLSRAPASRRHPRPGRRHRPVPGNGISVPQRRRVRLLRFPYRQAPGAGADHFARRRVCRDRYRGTVRKSEFQRHLGRRKRFRGAGAIRSPLRPGGAPHHRSRGAALGGNTPRGGPEAAQPHPRPVRRGAGADPGQPGGGQPVCGAAAGRTRGPVRQQKNGGLRL
ncbi:MAG: AAA family ATPase [SAR324 cluster bacterium]|nr:AAA family ATPase [SAR324 cluster bacterium]